MKKVALLIMILLSSTNIVFAQGEFISDWSENVMGLRARLILEQKERLNDTPIIYAYLELNNTYPIFLELNRGRNMHFTVIDSENNELSAYSGPFDGFNTFPEELFLPFDSVLKFNISWKGHGIPKNRKAMMDLGPGNAWVIKKDDKTEYFLKMSLEIERKFDRTERPYWHGRLEIPKIKIPTKNEKDPLTTRLSGR